MDLKECKDALELFGYDTVSGNTWSQKQLDDIPFGCSYRISDKAVHFNSGDFGKNRDDLFPICRKTGNISYTRNDREVHNGWFFF